MEYGTMKIQESAENYLETILVLKNKNGSVRSIDIANALSFSKPSISIAMKILRENGYIHMDDCGLITLSVSEETAAADACKIEHDISEESFTKIKEHALRKQNN